MLSVRPPWTAPLTDSEHSLVLYGLVVVALALAATLVRVRFGSGESHGTYRTASLTANAVVAIAGLSYVVLIGAFLLGYRERAGVWYPTPVAQLAWSVRYMDWCVTVPLLVIELTAVSGLVERTVRRVRAVGVALAVVMVTSGYLGGVVVDGGRDFAALAVCGGIGALCFLGLYAIVLLILTRSVPVIPSASRPSLQAAVALLLVVWLAYPVVYGLQGATAGGAWAVVGQLVLCAADAAAKIGFGGLVHRTAVLRSRADELADPEAPRPRSPQADAVWVVDDDLVPLREDGGAFPRRR